MVRIHAGEPHLFTLWPLGSTLAAYRWIRTTIRHHECARCEAIPNEVIPVILDQLSKIVRHDHAVLTIRNGETAARDVYALHSMEAHLLEAVQGLN